jgi:hypothetical protein
VYRVPFLSGSVSTGREEACPRASNARHIPIFAPILRWLPSPVDP